MIPALFVAASLFLLGFLALAQLYVVNRPLAERVIDVLVGLIVAPIVAAYSLWAWLFHLYAALLWWEYNAAERRLRDLFAYSFKKYPEYRAYWERKRMGR